MKALAALLFLAVINNGFAHEGHPGEAAATPARPAAAATPGTRDARTYFTDTELVDQDGRRLRFYSDVLKDRVVLVNVIYTHCEDACPLITRTLTEVRARLGERFGKDVFFVSITNDPERDSPQALKKFAASQNADVPGWTFLTGKPDKVKAVLAKLGQASAQVEDHLTVLFVLNIPEKRSLKLAANLPLGAIVEQVKRVADGDSPGARK